MSWLITGSEKNITDPYRSSVSLLLHGDGANTSTTITDSSPSPKTVTAVGFSTISTAQQKFGSSSIFVLATGQTGHIYIDKIPAFGTNDWTIEFWYYATQLNTNSCLLDFRTAGAQAVPTILVVSNKLNYYVNGSSRIIGTTNVPLNQWFHVAVTKASGETRQFLDGIEEGSTYTDTFNYISNTNRPIVGVLNGLNYSTSTPGYIDELRITQNVARYTSNFTPPTAAFPDF